MSESEQYNEGFENSADIETSIHRRWGQTCRLNLTELIVYYNNRNTLPQQSPKNISKAYSLTTYYSKSPKSSQSKIIQQKARTICQILKTNKMNVKYEIQKLELSVIL